MRGLGEASLDLLRRLVGERKVVRRKRMGLWLARSVGVGFWRQGGEDMLGWAAMVGWVGWVEEEGLILD